MLKIIWVDEVGRWAWAWPVVAWACLFDLGKIINHSILSELKDSKKLSKQKREIIHFKLQKLEENWLCYLGIGIKSNKIVDKIGIKKANKLAMEDAINEILDKIKKKDLNFEKLELQIDWNDKYIFDKIDLQTTFIIKWDNLVNEIKAASIWAKVTRDRLMVKLSKKYKWYNLENNVWYGTKKHINALKKLWITPIHRKSYKPVKNLLIMS